jgi:hypothetical protein
MSDSESNRLRAHFESALQTYQTMTGIALAEHQLAVRLQNCDSIDSITTLFKCEARSSSDLQGSDRIMKSIESTVSILYTLSATASLGDVIDLVYQKALMGCSVSLTGFFSHSHLRKQYSPALLSYSLYVPFFSSYVGYPSSCDMQVNQEAKAIHPSYDALIDLLDSIERFLYRIDIYTQIPPTPVMDEIIVKIMAELLSTIAAATKELKQGRSSEFILSEMLPYSPLRSQICNATFRREGCRGDPAATGPTHAR